MIYFLHFPTSVDSNPALVQRQCRGLNHCIQHGNHSDGTSSNYHCQHRHWRIRTPGEQCLRTICTVTFGGKSVRTSIHIEAKMVDFRYAAMNFSQHRGKHHKLVACLCHASVMPCAFFTSVPCPRLHLQKFQAVPGTSAYFPQGRWTSLSRGYRLSERRCCSHGTTSTRSVSACHFHRNVYK